MAQTIEDLIVKLKAEGFENIDKLRGSFRELSKVTFSTETQIQRTRKELFDFARAAGNTDSVTKGLIDALRGLRAQADFCGASYGQLTTDLRRLNEVQQGATNSLLAQRNALVSTFSETTRVVRVLQDHREALVALQTQTRQNSSAFNTLANDIAAIDGRIQESTQIIGQYRRALTTALPATEAGARQRLQILQAGIDLQRETIQLIDEGTGAERRANAARKAEAAAELANLRQQQRQLIFQESARSGRLAVRTAAAAFNAPDLTEGFLAPSAMGGRGGVGEFAMPNTTAALNQELGELRERLNNTILSTENYNNVAVRMAAIQRELRDASAGVAAALYREFARGDIPPAVANLTQLLSALRTSQAALNTRTTEGAEAFRLYEMQARALERQLQQVREQQQGLTAAPIASGFREFSREATTRTAATAAEAEAALARSIARGRRKHGMLSPEDAEQVTATVNALSRAEIDASNAVRIATDRNAALWLKTQQLKNEHADRLNTELIASNDRVFQAELSQLDTLLAARDRYEVGRQVSKQYLGLGGRDLSSFYEQVVGLGVGTAGTTASKYQGRDFSRVLADTVDAFNLQLTESSRTAVEGMGLFKEAAIAHAGGSAKVREVLDRYEKNAIPENMYPFVGESGKDYERRLVSGANLFTQTVEAFNRALGRAGKSMDTAPALGAGTSAIPALGDVRQSTIRKLQETRDLLEQIRTDIPPIGKEAARVSKEVEQNLTKIDRELGRRERGGRHLTTGQAVQAGGAIISGGIFGGPEGFLGGLGGAALGSAISDLGIVGGSFAGAAVGAQLGMFRQQLAATTDYSARIDKMQIALRGIVGSQEAYNTVLTAAARVTKDLNIPQESVIQGMTRLSAAVLGAGGNVSDSTFAFSAITKAIKATGGSAEQADGAILALTQVFSKGKVSAEELNQIAERLPGTFTLFAKATGRTGPELLKALQDGKVGLNDLMKFLGTIDTQYGQTALRVAASTQDAGARMSIALQDMQLSVGRSLQPVGAALQATFTDFISTTAPAFVAVLKPVAATLQFISADPVGKELAKLTLYMGAATAASLLLKPALAGLAAVLAFTRTQVIALTAALAKNPLTLLAIAATAATLRIAEAILNQKRLNNEVQRTLTLAEKAPASTVATDINATEYALRKARTKAVADSKSDPFGIGASLAGLDVDRLEKKLLKLQRIYKGRIELDTIFKGMDPTAGVPTGYKRINGRLAYLSPGQGYVDAQTGKPISGGFTNAQGVSQETKDKLASSYLQAFDQRAEALAKARETREQAIANIRTKAAEDLLTLERTLGDERRRIEYDIDALRRKTAATERDRQFNLRHQAGEDPNTIDAARAFADINQKAADARAQLEQKFNEDELTQARTIADYQKGIAKEIAEVNRIHAKTVGEIQKDYAKAVAKIIEEGSGKAGKRLGIAGQLVANALERSSLNAIRLSVGAEPVPTPSGYRSGKPVYGAGPQPPTPFTTLDETRYRLLKQLQSRNPAGASATADRFFTAFANRSEYENVADLRNLPVQRMQRQAARPMLMFWEGMVDKATQKDFEGAYLRKRRFPNIASISSDTYPLLAGLRIGDPVPFVQPKGAAATTETRTRSKQAGEADIEATKRAEITALFTSSLGPSEQLTQSLKDQNAELAKQFDFLARGINPEMSRSLTTAQLVYERGLADAEAKRQQGIAEGFSVDLITEEYDNQVAALSRAYDINAGLIQQEDQRRKLIEDINKSTRSRFKGGLQQYYDSVSDLGTQLSNVVTNTFQGLEDQLTAFVTTGKMNFTDLANSIIADMTRILIRQIVIAPLLKGVGNLLNIKLNANGAAYAANGIVPFATGGIVSRPTFFRYANGGVPGTGLMGEAGPEAIMPLRRLPSGRLGVESAGGGTNVTVNVDATGSSVQGDSTQGAALGRAIAAAVQAELVNQKRRGGLLNS